MLKYILLPLCIQLPKTILYSIKPFVFPKNKIPNITDPNTYEDSTGINTTIIDLFLEEMIIDISKNETKWEEIILLDYN